MHRQGGLADTGGSRDSGDDHVGSARRHYRGQQRIQPAEFVVRPVKSGIRVRQLRWQRQSGRSGRAWRGLRRCRPRAVPDRGQDLLVEPLKRCRGLDTEFSPEPAACVSECRQSIRLTAGPVKRHHEQAMQPLAQRVLVIRYRSSVIRSE